MAVITAEERKRLKGSGIIPSKDPDLFTARIPLVNGVLTAERAEVLAEAARRFGNGKLVLTVRMCVELQGIPYEKTAGLQEFLKEHGLAAGGTGNRVRPVVCCKGTVCTHGLIDTQGLAEEVHERFYKGWYDVTLPHKFKIGIGGCPNNCVKPTLNDIGIMGARFPAEAGKPEEGFRVFVGGLWGKKQRTGEELPGIFTKEEVLSLIERILTVWKEKGQSGERFGAYLDRTGTEAFTREILNGK